MLVTISPTRLNCNSPGRPVTMAPGSRTSSSLKPIPNQLVKKNGVPIKTLLRPIPTRSVTPRMGIKHLPSFSRPCWKYHTTTTKHSDQTRPNIALEQIPLFLNSDNYSLPLSLTGDPSEVLYYLSTPTIALQNSMTPTGSCLPPTALNSTSKKRDDQLPLAQRSCW